tara:strand:+ start:79 stop:1209 length:1131 start_codon:yes stop_codon:yes gene_type:complete
MLAMGSDSHEHAESNAEGASIGTHVPICSSKTLRINTDLEMSMPQSERMSKSERLGCLYLTFLKRPGGLSFEEIRTLMPLAYTGEPESARRKFERDKDDLRKLGLQLRHYSPGEALPHRVGMADSHVYIPEDVPDHLNKIELNPSEREALAALLLRALERESNEDKREALTSIYIKLFYNNLPGDLPPVIPTGSAGSSEEPRLLHTVQEALMKHRVLKAIYEPASGRAEKQTLEGRGLIYYRGRWCLVAHSREKKDNRFYYLERFRDLEMLEQNYRPDKGFNLKSMSLHPLGISIHESRSIALEIASDYNSMFSNFLSGLQEDRVQKVGQEFRIQTTNERALFRWILQRPESLIKLDKLSAARMNEFLTEIQELYN